MVGLSNRRLVAFVCESAVEPVARLTGRSGTCPAEDEGRGGGGGGGGGGGDRRYSGEEEEQETNLEDGQSG
jgi:hypothetical protein